MTQEARNIRNLIDELNRLTVLYDMGTPEVSDPDWDLMYFTLVNMESNTGIIYPDSPTQKIYFSKVSELKKIIHNHPMLSLAKTKDPEEIYNFFKGKNQDWYGMFKMDGLTCSLTYKNGKLVRAETRGDGEEGEDVLHNAFVIKSIPKEIPNKELTIIDGEIICDIETFEKYFAKDYKNPRNFAAGSIRQLNSEETYMRKLTFVAWDLIQGIDEDFNFWRLEHLDDWGFTTVPRVGDAETVEDAIEILTEMHEEDSIYSKYPIDGFVFKFESKSYGDSLGKTDHHFNNAIAYKFYDEEYETNLKYIDYDVSRNGVLTPVAVFKPIEIDGSVVERASLHNISIMEDVLGDTPYVGEPILVFKANMIIPQISKAKKLPYGEIIAGGGVTTGLGGDYGVLCPICGKPTSIITSDTGVKTLICDNEKCEGKLAQRIDYYCSKKGLDIKGLSRKTIEKLIDWGWVDSIKDIYKLHAYQMQWIEKNGFGKASVFKILDAIDKSRENTDLANFIAGLGIPLVGKTIAKEIVKYYPTWKEFRNAVGDDWTRLDGFGPEMNVSIKNFNYEEADEIVKIIKFKEAESQVTDSPAAALKDKIFVITGKLTNWKNRAELKEYIESLGGKVTDSVSSKTSYLINNDINSTSSKNKKALSLNIPIITEQDFLGLIQ